MTWFITDVISILPLDLMFNTGSFNKISRFSRIGRISKLLRLMKIFRLMKFARVSNKLVKHLGDILKITASTERLLLLMLMFFTLQHVIACLW